MSEELGHLEWIIREEYAVEKAWYIEERAAADEPKRAFVCGDEVCDSDLDNDVSSDSSSDDEETNDWRMTREWDIVHRMSAQIMKERKVRPLGPEHVRTALTDKDRVEFQCRPGEGEKGVKQRHRLLQKMARNEADNQTFIYFFTPEYMNNCRLFGELLRKTKVIDGSVEELLIVSPQRERSDSESSDEDRDEEYEYWGDGEISCPRKHRGRKQEPVAMGAGEKALPSVVISAVEETLHMTTASLAVVEVEVATTKARSWAKKRREAQARSDAQRLEAEEHARAKAPSTAKKKLGGLTAQGLSAASSSTLNPLTKEAAGWIKKQQQYQRQQVAGQEDTDHGAPTIQLSKSFARHQGIPRGAPIGIQSPASSFTRVTGQFKLYQGCDLGAQGDKPALSTFYALQSTSATAASCPTLNPPTMEASRRTDVVKATKAERSKETRGSSRGTRNPRGTAGARECAARQSGEGRGAEERDAAHTSTFHTVCVQQSRVNVVSIAMSVVNVKAARAPVYVIYAKCMYECMHRGSSAKNNEMKHVAPTE